MRDSIYLSKEHTSCLRGFFALLVVAHHIYQNIGLTKTYLLGEILHLCGTLSVAVFLFFSGYGLMLSSSKNNYIKKFFRNRFLPLYCFYVVLIIVYTIWKLFLENSFSSSLVIHSFLFGATVVEFGWYLQTTFILYLIYLLVFRFIKSQKLRIVFIFISCFIYFVACYILRLGSWWYQTIFCFVFGMIYCYKKTLFDAILAKRSWLIFGLSGALFLAFAVFNRVFPAVSVLYSFFFVCFTISISYVLCKTRVINNPVLSLLGKYSLEIYVAHGLFIKFYKLGIINNRFVYLVVVLVGTAIVSFILKCIYKGLLSLISAPKESKA